MGSEREEGFKKRKGQRKAKKQDNEKLAPYRYLIVCEGEKTEPNYFEGIRNKINAKYAARIRVEGKVELQIEGTGRNTNDLVNYVARLVNKTPMFYEHIWVIFDKDDFTDDQFNSAIEQAESKGYKVGWSNEAIELWFLLHFEYLNTGIGREKYCEKLSQYFKEYNISNGKYKKNMEDIFDILEKHGSMGQAINGSTKLLKEYEDSSSPAKMKPATTVFKLVEELKEYF